MSDGALEYRVQARNLSHASENRIHDDDVARRFGFRGALVPGVEVYAYMTHLPAARWGVEWLERGTAECRFLKPVYDGKLVTVSATATTSGLSISVHSEGEQCATGAAALPDTPPFVLSVAQAKRSKEERPPPLDARPDAHEESLPVGRLLSSNPLHVTLEYLEKYLIDIGETAALYAREKLMHPALYLRLSNAALKENVKLGPWIHAASSIRHCGVAHAGASLAAHAKVAANYERKGHRFVDLDLDIVIVADERRAVAQVRHTAIYKLRQG